MSPESTTSSHPSNPLRWLGALQWLTAIGLVLFWAYFFAVESRRPDIDPVYLGFERSFPIPDLCWLMPLLLLGGSAMRKRQPVAVPLAIAAGGAMVFLGLLDASFNLQQGRYTLSLADGLINGFINSYCMIFGTVLIVWPWRARVALATADEATEPNPDVRAEATPPPSPTIPRGAVALAGRHVAVTGGSSGIGLATARKLAALGAHVAILARDRDRLDAAARSIDDVKLDAALPCLPLPCDVTDRGQVANAFKAMAQAGRTPEILINSAGVPWPGYFEDQPVELFERHMRVNYFGTLHTIKQALPGMSDRRDGYIVNISSVAGFLGIFGYAGYASSKFAVWGLSEVLRAELRHRGITVSVVCPPDTETPQWHEENRTKPAETKAIAGSIEPLPADVVADAIIRGMLQRRFLIIPGWQSKFLPPLLGLARPLVHWVFDRKVDKLYRTANPHG
ncbi:MAG: SDR family oxidoreductase [Phycisphaerae bacterium]|nr:SDR family oxidoreductase [Phycisphaerae bacterium]